LGSSVEIGEDPTEDADGSPANLAASKQSPIGRQLLAGNPCRVAERLDGQRRHAVAASRDDAVDDVDRDLRPASAQMPARASGKREIDDHRDDANRQSTGQCQKPERVDIAGEQAGDERDHREGGR
jgi:hypothetical protein